MANGLHCILKTNTPILQRPLLINRSRTEAVVLLGVVKPCRVVELVRDVDAVRVLDVQEQVVQNGYGCSFLVASLFSQRWREERPPIGCTWNAQSVNKHGHDRLVLSMIGHVGAVRTHTLLREQTLLVRNQELVVDRLVHGIHNDVIPCTHSSPYGNMWDHMVLDHELQCVRIHPFLGAATRDSRVHSIVPRRRQLSADAIPNHIASILPERHCLPPQRHIHKRNGLPRVTPTLNEVSSTIHPHRIVVPRVNAIGNEPV